jgi:hypothetical protein
MPGDVIESTPIAVPVIAPSSQDRAAIESQQDAAWADDATDTGGDTPAADGSVSSDDEGVIVDKPGLSGAVPAPKPGARDEGPAASDKAEDEVTPESETVTPEAKSESYWKTLSGVFPNASAVSQSDKFKSWFASLSQEDKAAASNIDDPDASIRIMGRYSDDVMAGRVADPEPPAPPKAFEIAEHIKARNMDGLKIKLASGEETTLGAMSKPEEFGDIIAAMGVMTDAAEKSVMSQATQLIQNLVDQGVLVTGSKFNQLLERLGEKDLTTKVPDASTVTSDPEFIKFRDKQPLLKKAWAGGDADSRAEVIAMFKADKARNAVSDTAAGQRRTNSAKNDLHKGSLRSGASQGKSGDEGKSTAEQQDAAWETPLDVEGQKV